MAKKVEISYRPHKHQSEFRQRPERFRALFSGIGGGKTKAGAMESIETMFRYPNSHGMIVAPCYDEETEILTETGWKKFMHLEDDDKVGCLEKENLVFNQPTDIIAQPYRGELIGYKSENLDMLVTPNHRCYVKFKKKGVWKIKTAEEIYGRWDYQFKSVAEWKGDDEGEEDWFEFLGYWFAEGFCECSKRKNRVGVTTVNDVAYAESLMKKNFFKYSKDKRQEGGYNFTVYGKELAETFIRYGKAINKKVPQYVLNASPRLLKKFLHGYMVGDGTYKKSKKSQSKSTTASKYLADDLQIIALKCGINACVRLYENKGKYSIPGSVSYYVGYKTSKRDKCSTSPQNWYKKFYDGLVYCVEVPSGVVLVRRGGVHYFCGNTYRMLADSTQRTFLEEMPTELIADFRRGDQSLTTINGSNVIFRSADDPDKMRGPNLGWIWMDEARLMPGLAWDIAIGRLRELPERAWITSTTKGRDWMWRDFVDGPTKKPELQDDYWYCTFSTDENPHLTDAFVRSIRTKYTGAFLEQEFYAKFVAFEGLVYPVFNREIHVIKDKDIPEGLTHYGLYDFGFTNPSVILVLGLDADDRMWILDEFYQTGVTPETYVKIALEYHDKYKFHDGAADPSSPDYIASMRQAGIPLMKAHNPIMEGISLVNSRLAVQEDGHPRLYVHERCVNTINEFEQYRYPERKEEKPVREEPLKVYDHSMDCIRYGAFLVEELKRGMVVIGSIDDIIG